jgi:uncharacterized protein (TIGR02145 family)
MKRKRISLAILLFLLGCQTDGEKTNLKEPKVPTAIFVDLRDGNEYKIIQIGDQIWFAENLRYASENSYCYKNKEENCKKFGRLYTNNPNCTNIKGSNQYGNPLSFMCTQREMRHVISDSLFHTCPKGWHIPSTEDWDTLFQTVGNHNIAGKKLKSSKGWRFGNNGNDDFDFNVIPVPGGELHYGKISFDDNSEKGTNTCFWSQSKNIFQEGVERLICFNLSDSIKINIPWYGGNDPTVGHNYFMFPIRCIITNPVEEQKQPNKKKSK